jgi:hypothetical protein
MIPLWFERVRPKLFDVLSQNMIGLSELLKNVSAHKKTRKKFPWQNWLKMLMSVSNECSIESRNLKYMKTQNMLLVLVLILSVILFFTVKKRVWAQDIDMGKAVKADSGLQYVDSTTGTGLEAKFGSTVFVHYTGWLWDGKTKGTKFDSSLDRGQSFSFILGAGRVIKGWDEGVKGMKIGGKRTLIIPSDLGYGARGAGSAIPPNADLVFDVELLDVK